MTGEYFLEEKRKIRNNEYKKETLYKNYIVHGQRVQNQIAHANM